MIKFAIGNNAIRSYRRLAYTPWHAMAEFVDNSSQAYFNHRQVLDESYQKNGEKLEVSIAYDADRGILTIADNSIGMDITELGRALQVGVPPENSNGRSRYGMGMKTAACWIGNFWTVETKKLGDKASIKVVVDVEKIADGQEELPTESFPKDPGLHYTLNYYY